VVCFFFKEWFVPKMKTNKAAAKRFRLTATGKIVRHHSGARHILTSKPRSRKRRLRSKDLVSKGDARRVRRMLSS